MNMNPDRHDLLSIGVFSDAAQLSLKALRLYAQLGILSPTYTDPATGYRYYHTDQLDTARLIRMMRQMDMPLATIRRVLAADPNNAEAMVIEHWGGLQKRLELARVTVQDLICAIKGVPTTMPLQIEVKTLPNLSIVSITRHITADKLNDAIADGVSLLQTYLGNQRIETEGVPFGIYHGEVSMEADGPVEICLATPTLLTTTGEIQARTLPGGQAASTTLLDEQCAYPEVMKGYDALVDWMRNNGYEPTGSPREAWAEFPDIEAQMDVQWLFREKQG